ncbi:MAG: type II toxin-antitoxin system RelE/ParE family toxin [Gammaproteobacteria bacterium]|nr:type II toxin-antitoxin system RelE/ParE family toxin [Gammaproteobacteria bacterium]
MFEISEYVDSQGNSPYARWFRRLDPVAAAKVTTTIYRMEQGNLSNAKGVGSGVFEQRINFGPGYRIYFGRDGNRLIILLGGGTKARQQRDIESAEIHWRNYRQRKRQEVLEHAIDERLQRDDSGASRE